MSHQTSTPPPEEKPSRTALKFGAIFLVSLLFGFFVVAYVIPMMNRPKPDITLLDGSDGFQGFNYVVYVDVGFKNHGGEGWVIVYSELRGGGRYEEKSSRIYMASGETKQIQFVFDVGFWDTLFSTMTYKAWAVAD